ncbi:MAG: hypothetical protein JNJ90_00370, partial [Saprospiraceae bacterium]|nr:hypothetical protein [Saprospiraceae bacterium]
MKTTLRLLLPACLLLSGIFSTHFASATPAGHLTGTPSGIEAPPVLGTKTWTGSTSTDWHDPSNWSPAGTPLSGSSGDDVVIPVVVSGNYPVVTAVAAARSISIDAGASLNVNAGGTLNVVESATDGVTNAGTLTNAGTMLVNLSFNDGIVNQANALISNSGSLKIIEGTGNRLENYGTVTNTAGTFTVDGGLDVDLINHPGATITNSGGSFIVQNGMARRVDNYGSIANSATFTISGAAAGEGLINHPNATISNTGGIFFVQYGTAREVENYGTITNTANFTIYGGSTGECLVNRAGALVANNSGTFDVRQGTDMRIDNYGTITNAGTFNIGGASTGSGLFNRDGAVVTSTAGTFEISGGNTIQVENDGKITNSGTFKISGTSSGDDLINRDTVINNAGGTFSVELGEARILDNSGYVYNAGALILRYCSGFGVVDEAVRNQANAKIINAAGSSFKVGNSYTLRLMTNHGLLQIDGDADISACSGAGLLNTPTGTVNVQDSLSAGGCLNYAITNENIFTLGSAGILAVKSVGGGQGFINSGSFSSAVGSSLFFGGTSSHLIRNNAGGVFENNSAMRFENSGGAKILNTGRYTHLNGTWKYDGGDGLLTNNGYFHLNVPITITGFTGASLFYNTDSLILGVLCNFTFSSTNYIFINDPGAYLYSDAQFTFENIGFSVLENKGKAVMGPSSVLRGKRLPSSTVISNTDSLFLQGTIEISRFAAYGIKNTGYTENSGSFFSNYTEKGILNNGGTFVNSGS